MSLVVNPDDTPTGIQSSDGKDAGDSLVEAPRMGDQVGEIRSVRETPSGLLVKELLDITQNCAQLLHYFRFDMRHTRIRHGGEPSGITSELCLLLGKSA